ncbi:hypothetical protein O6H91_18G011400 [Diphasiastrum complanatum]|nr:hypothetical protein O6H91_18G011400 [Diphasiastrum complanatum]KAJ7522454.1 hypothetical protein O6H91_18G011400 [Diphasiastrum complanatum]
MVCRIHRIPLFSALPDDIGDARHAVVYLRAWSFLKRPYRHFGNLPVLPKMQRTRSLCLMKLRHFSILQYKKPNVVLLNSSCENLSKVVESEGVLKYGQHSCSMHTITTSAMPGGAAAWSSSASKSDLKRSLLDERLVKAIAYEGEKGLVNAMGRTTRFGDYLLSQLLVHLTSVRKDASSWSQKLFEMLTIFSGDAKKYDTMTYYERFALLNQISQLLGFEGVVDLIEHQAAGTEASEGSECEDGQHSKSNPYVESNDKQLSLKECQIDHQLSFHPAITFGSSERIELYNPLHDAGAKMSQPDSTTSQNGQAEYSQSRESHTVGTEETEAQKNNAGDSKGSLVSQTLAVNGNQHQKKKAVSAKRSEKKKTSILDGSAVNNDWMLDTPVSFIKCLTKDNQNRLEENGIHTLRMLLHHFPRTYVNHEQAGQTMEDGKHLTFFGIIVSCRGLRLGSSLGAIEVIVKSIVDQNSNDSNPDDSKIQMENDPLHRKEESQTTVFLHLKRFFRGSRFTNQWFLNKMASKYPEGVQAAVSGKVKALSVRGHYEIRDFYLEVLEEEKEYTNGIEFEDLQSRYSVTDKPYPVYPAKGYLQPKAIEYYLQRVLSSLPLDLDPLPGALREKLQLMELRQAYIAIHAPASIEEAKKARHRLVFDEFFYLQMSMLLQKQQMMEKFLEAVGLPSSYMVEREYGLVTMDKWSPLTQKLVESLPYKLTECQIKVISEIICDLQKPVPMNRLLQGDVGCGKTIVAFLALLEVVGAGYQGAFMAPTEFLANQHYERILSWLELLRENVTPRVALLTGSTTLSKARAIRRGLESGDITLVVGTHSLISDSVKFSALALAVIDEQHRFGVGQRERFNSKASIRDSMEGIIIKEHPECGFQKQNVKFLGVPHVLVMSATPIPRTLALALHGDMALSQITEIPPGRPPTITYTFYGDEKGRQAAHKMVHKELEKGGQVFVIYPVIEDSEELPDLRSAVVEYGKLSTEFKDFKVGLAHGRMKVHEKEEALSDFREGKTQLLISTTVIEVGVDIPEASMIVVEHAERYGMAQLHQLRGRVGRGSRESSCILLSSSPSALNRLKILEASKDGFYLAEEDLKHRGPGDLLGKRQSGYLPEFSIARLEEDGEILEQAREAAEEIVEQSQSLEALPHLKRELSMRRPPGTLS